MAAFGDLSAEFGNVARSMGAVDRQPLESIQVFISYAESQRDREMKEELRAALSSLQHSKTINIWDRSQIPAGANTKDTIMEKLEAAKIVLLLISSDFTADEGMCKLEMDWAIARSGVVRVIPVPLRAVFTQDSQFDGLQPLPPGDLPISQWSDRDEAYLKVVQGIKNVCDSIRRSDDWDRQIEEDIENGRLSAFADIAVANYHAGESQDLPTHE